MAFNRECSDRDSGGSPYYNSRNAPINIDVFNYPVSREGYDGFEKKVVFQKEAVILDKPIIKDTAMTIDASPIKESKPDKTFKICDNTRKNKKYLKAATYPGLISIIRSEYNVPETQEIRLFLTKNPTEIVDNGYLDLVDDYTKLMYLTNEQTWLRKVDGIEPISVDGTPASKAAQIICRIVQNDCFISLLKDEEIEMLMEMDVKEVNTVLTNNKCTMFEKEQNIVKDIKEAATNTHFKNMEAREALDLVKHLRKQYN